MSAGPWASGADEAAQLKGTDMDQAFIRKGDGYERGSRTGEDGRCTAFDGFTVIAAPLAGQDAAGRESRVFRGERPGSGCDYSSHEIKLATDGFERGLYILMQHGGGREVLRLPDFYGAGLVDNRAALLAMPERQLYAMLYMIWQAAGNARQQATDRTAVKWRDAFLDGRIRKSRPKGGYFRVSIESESERDLRLGKARPSRIAIDVATGEAMPA
jgi:hypothetical protein